MADKNHNQTLKKKQAKAKDKKKHIYEQVNTKDKNPVGSLMRTGRVLFFFTNFWFFIRISRYCPLKMVKCKR